MFMIKIVWQNLYLLAKRSVSLRFVPLGLLPDNYFTVISLIANNFTSGNTVASVYSLKQFTIYTINKFMSP